MRIYKVYIGLVLIIFTFAFFMSGVRRDAVEQLAIDSAVGYDLEDTGHGIEIRSSTASRYLVTRNEVKSTNITTRGETIGKAREERQRRIDKKILIGLEKVYIIGENYAKHGISDLLDIFFRNAEIRDSTLLCVCEGKAEDILKLKIEGYPSAGDYIEGILRYSREMGFFKDNYMLIDAYVRIDEEGRNLVLPYITVKDNIIEIYGLAIFQQDRMVAVLPMQKAKYCNILRENKVTGLLTLQKNSDDYLSLFSLSKRKIKCRRENGKYKFDINIKLIGQIMANDYEPLLINKPDKKREAEAMFAADLKQELEAFIKDLKHEYKIDTLELGRVAAAKYGRNTGVDWNKVFLDSEIKINVTCKINRFGRGDF
ncbi:MAG: Ger(x)C family spore germination protein [Clostridiales bacterium]|nr:Ger(x)C family spore germination protein [Clostridiales bacterium]